MTDASFLAPAELDLDTELATPDHPAAPTAPPVQPGAAFAALGLHAAIARAVHDAGYEMPTDVQSRAIPPALERRDLRVSSSTGSGKTASFVLPALQRILAARQDPTQKRQKGVTYGPRILVLAPTRELAMQVAKAADGYGRHIPGLRVATVLGGVPYGAQLKALRGPLDVLIATPGRLIDHVQSGKAVLDNVEMLVLDEADRMLDMGFIDDIGFIAECTPKTRQTVMYSATFAGHVGRLAEQLLNNPLTIDVASHTDTHEHIEQRLHWADDAGHKDALLDHLLTQREIDQALVFTSTQRDADILADRLADMGHAVASLHGGMPQGRRNRVLHGLRSRQLRVLVATDVAARGIDVPTISHVINYGLPMKAEDYVHRIGRTGRAGRSGLAVTLAERGDALMIQRIQRFTTQDIPVATITGLEPRRPVPQFRPARDTRGGRPGGKPFGPHRGGHPGARGDRPQRDHGDQRPWHADRAPRADGPMGGAPRHADDRQGGWGDQRPAGPRPHHGPGMAPNRGDVRFAGPRAHGDDRRPSGWAPAHPGERTPRTPGGRPGFGPRRTPR